VGVRNFTFTKPKVLKALTDRVRGDFNLKN
jgi:hypothetical protein